MEVTEGALGEFSVDLQAHGWFPDMLPSEEGEVEGESSDSDGEEELEEEGEAEAEDEEAAAYHT